uniref:Uncharacterized protein MANES_01G039700 n=1 Tax=Rhizophora mucronata TaxID=61149 RepID=A0A2P2LTJ1_RHIMU
MKKENRIVILAAIGEDLSIFRSPNRVGCVAIVYAASLSSFSGVDFSNAVLDRVNFGKANLQGAVFRNAVLSGSTFEQAQLADAVFEDTIIGYIDLQKICANSTIGPDGRANLGCR